MKFMEIVRNFISDGTVKEASKNFLEDIIGALNNDPVAAAKVAIAVIHSPWLLREQIFWSKFSGFLDGIAIDDSERAKFCAKLMQDGKKEENSIRLISYIDKAENKKKVQFIINATRCFIMGWIDLPLYFRICHVIVNTLEEDLYFLKEHLEEKTLPDSYQVKGLLVNGLMYQHFFGGDNGPEYSFTPLAKYIDQYAVSFDDVARYPNPTKIPDKDLNLPTGIEMSQDAFASDEAVQEMINETFGSQIV